MHTPRLHLDPSLPAHLCLRPHLSPGSSSLIGLVPLTLFFLLYLPSLLLAATNDSSLPAPSSTSPSTTPQSALLTLRDSQQEPLARLLAARFLLRQNDPDFLNQLRLDLATSPDLALQKAILQSLAETPTPPPQFIPILLDMLSSTPEPLLNDLAAALSRYDPSTITAPLITLASQPNAPLNARIAAITALSYHRSQPVAATLIPLIDSRQPPTLRSAAATAMIRITGIVEFGADPQLWQRWWNQHQNLSPQAWQNALFQNFDRSREQLLRQLQSLQDRLLETQRQLYRAASPDKRPAILANMLADSLDPIRLLGLSLCDLTLGDAGPSSFTPELRQSLTDKLLDPNPEIRRRSALLLRDLNDSPAADRVASFLAENSEPRPELLRAYLLLLTRQPKSPAINPALTLLDNPSLRKEAASFLTAAADQNLLSPSQSSQILSSLRSLLPPSSSTPDPSLIPLFGRLAQSSDWPTLESWLDHPDPTIKETAARTWAASQQPLSPLMTRAHDSALFPILLDALARRGSTPDLFTTLLDSKPADSSLLEPWQRALIALASRIPPSTILQVQPTLIQQNLPIDFRNRLLSSSLDSLLPSVATAPADIWKQLSSSDQRLAILLLLSRAENLLLTNDPKAALADTLRLPPSTSPLLPVDLHPRYSLLLLRCRLLLNDDLDLLSLAQSALNQTPFDPSNPTAQSIYDAFLPAIKHALSQSQPDRAKSLFTTLSSLLPQPIPSPWAPAISDLQLSPPLTPPLAPTLTSPLPPTPPPPATIPATPSSAPATSPASP